MTQQLPEQELRLAVVMTGGVSLAIWMGGVAAEIDQLLRAKDDRPSEEQKVYAALLALANYVPRLDVVSGTSAGGVNGALLAGAVARRKTLEGLRDIWLQVASYRDLLRSPYAKDQPSLLKGDEYFTPELQKGISKLLGDEDVEGDDEIQLLITTTLITGEDHGLVDDFGTAVPDVKHDGLFRFDGDTLRSGSMLSRRLALAARSSASFPIAFEPSWVPREGDDDMHPGMAGIADFRSDRYVIDGGVLVNRPVEPALRAMFAMPASVEDIRRVLLYVVPDPGESGTDTPDLQTHPPMLSDVALRSLVTLPRTQSIARDFESLKEHNARVRSQRDARDLILERWFPRDLDGETAGLLEGYRKRRAAREVEWLLGELNRRWPKSLTGSKIRPLDRHALARELKTARDATLPKGLPAPGDPAPDEVGAWGVDSVERAASVTLDLAQHGFARAAGDEDARAALARARMEAHRALARLRQLRRRRRERLRDREPDESVAEWANAMLAVMRSDDKAVCLAATRVARALSAAADAARGLGDDRLQRMCDRLAPVSPEAGPAEMLQAMARMLNDLGQDQLADMVRSLSPLPGGRAAAVDDGDRLRRLFALEVLQDAIGIDAPVVEQTVKLLQVSANTRDALTQVETARDKLTGMHLAHFAAFYKPSWRANDWMWGRLDAAGWLAQLLLDPERLEAAVAGGSDGRADAVARIRAIAVPDGHAWLADRFADDEERICAELAWLAPGSTASRPTALPQCSLAVARRLQLSIVSAELPELATAVRLDAASQALSGSGEAFLAVWNDGNDGSPEHLSAALAACRFAGPGFEGELESGLLATSASGTAATLTSALTGARSGLPKLITERKLTGSLRGLALAVHGMVQSSVRRSRTAFAAMIVAMSAGGALLAAAVIADGTQPGFISLGATIIFAGWIVALARAPNVAGFIGYTAVVVVFCAALALAPWGAGKLLGPGGLKDFVTGLEPAAIALALVVGAAAFGWRAVPTEA